MSAICLAQQRVPKTWGRSRLWPGFADATESEERIGEVWFVDPAFAQASLMVKALFTSEPLSIQVHPSDHDALLEGHARGKDEAWFVLAAEPGAAIALGTKQPMSPAALRRAALDGSIEHLVRWHPVRAGDAIYVPAGTLHALGAGLTLIEIQQNIDLTYRLYDFGRPRPLQIDRALESAFPGPFHFSQDCSQPSSQQQLLCAGPKFSMERWTGPMNRQFHQGTGTLTWAIPLAAGVCIDQQLALPGQCWVLQDAAKIQIAEHGALLLARPTLI